VFAGTAGQQLTRKQITTRAWPRAPHETRSVQAGIAPTDLFLNEYFERQKERTLCRVRHD
jgi:hypothetical protein